MLELETAELARRLEVLGLDDLRSEWRRLYGPPPKLRSPELLRRLLAWRIQADRLGGLDAATRRILKRASFPRDRRQGLGEGARISREWRGRRYDVDRVDGGFAFEGQTYQSLSEVARKITGVRWNGPRFFGLRNEAGAQ